MKVIDSAAAFARAMTQPLEPALERLLAIRHDQLGSDIENAARFVIVEPPDSLADVEVALAFPLVIDGEPTWEWIERHSGGVWEAAFVFSDDGPADVLLVPDVPGLDAKLADLLRQHAPSHHERLRSTPA